MELLEAQLRILRAIALAQSRWREVAAAIAAGDPLPLEGVTPDEETAVLNLQFRRLAPQERDALRARIDALEAALEPLRAGVSERDSGADQSRQEEAPGELLSTVPPDARWFAVAPRSGTVFTLGTATSPRGESHTYPYAVRLMNDYTADWPLWPASSEVADELNELLDDHLATRLRRWAQVFNAHYDHSDGWDDHDLAAEHRAEADRLLADLRAALPLPWVVTLDYWETKRADR
ncbi:hypothetical protein [Oerskovia flava]|uniref:hypothetical protein n=1 Tax=Oerskovia flava TaxID=2986422 RepID=UPI002240E220|nr:hypothetical protein [Oerskovia sp. JB1-3-2]